jgi:hypothetical protein
LVWQSLHHAHLGHTLEEDIAAELDAIVGGTPSMTDGPLMIGAEREAFRIQFNRCWNIDPNRQQLMAASSQNQHFFT